MTQNRAKAVFLAAIEEIEPDQWPAFLDDACTGDESLRADVEELLRGHRTMGTFHENTNGYPAVTVDALCVASVGEEVVLLDAAGAAVGDAITWYDPRGLEEAVAFMAGQQHGLGHARV